MYSEVDLVAASLVEAQLCRFSYTFLKNASNMLLLSKAMLVNEIYRPLVLLVDLLAQPGYLGVAHDVPPQHLGVVCDQDSQVRLCD